MAILRQKEARGRDYALLLFRMTSMVLYSAHYHRQHCTLHAFEQFGALYMRNHDGPLCRVYRYAYVGLIFNALYFFLNYC